MDEPHGQQSIDRFRRAFEALRTEMAKAIVGQDAVIEGLLVALFARGHCLLIGVPGLAKTLMISTLARCLSLSFKRIQFTPDLMPSDITGTEVIQEDHASGERVFKFLPGPLFANVVLADEINRTPPKTQAALLEAMQERQITVGGERHPLPRPFFVLATQNPIEQEGTYPLPEAQQDRFMFNLHVDYPAEDEEYQIMRLTTGTYEAELEPVLGAEEILSLQDVVFRVPISDEVVRYAIQLARLTRVHKAEAPDFVREWLSWGAGPRAGQYLILAAKARAVLRGRTEVQAEDIDAVARPVLRHRIILNYTADAENVTPDQVIDRLIEHAAASRPVAAS